MRQASLNKVTPLDRKPKQPKEKGFRAEKKAFKVEPKLNRNGSEYGASRRGFSQLDRGSTKTDNKVESIVPIKGMYNESGYPVTKKVKTFLGDSDYPLIIDKERKRFDAAEYGSADKQGKGQQLRRAKQEFEDEKMGKIRKNYSEGRRGNNRGELTYLKKTEKNTEAGGVDSRLEVASDQIYGANKRFQRKVKGTGTDGKKVTRDADYIRTRKNLLGRNVTIDKRADFGAVTKGRGTKTKLVGDKVVTRSRTVTDSGGIPFIAGKNARKYGTKTRSVSRVGTSTKKGFAASGDTRGVVSNVRLGITNTGEDVKTKKLASHRVIGRTNSNRRKGKGLR